MLKHGMVMGHTKASPESNMLFNVILFAEISSEVQAALNYANRNQQLVDGCLERKECCNVDPQIRHSAQIELKKLFESHPASIYYFGDLEIDLKKRSLDQETQQVSPNPPHGNRIETLLVLITLAGCSFVSGLFTSLSFPAAKNLAAARKLLIEEEQRFTTDCNFNFLCDQDVGEATDCATSGHGHGRVENCGPVPFINEKLGICDDTDTENQQACLDYLNHQVCYIKQLGSANSKTCISEIYQNLLDAKNTVSKIKMHRDNTIGAAVGGATGVIIIMAYLYMYRL
eukprot:NODE_754_length_4199_cov_1.046829.p3 type:complete len:286 gc:universal NODE_754_length_4199_cov_1.046829:1281-2138(+)